MALFIFVTGLYLFFCTGLGIFLGTITRSMPLLLQKIMAFVPSTSFVSMAQAILFRGAGIEVILQEIAIVVIVGTLLFIYSIHRFRRFLEQQG